MQHRGHNPHNPRLARGWGHYGHGARRYVRAARPEPGQHVRFGHDRQRAMRRRFGHYIGSDMILHMSRPTPRRNETNPRTGYGSWMRDQIRNITGRTTAAIDLRPYYASAGGGSVISGGSPGSRYGRSGGSPGSRYNPIDLSRGDL